MTCGSSGSGIGPSIFPTKQIWTDYDVTYTTIDGRELVQQAIYYDYSGGTIVTVNLTYSSTYNPIYLGHELKDHQFNVFTGSFELVSKVSDPSTHTLTELKTIELLGLSTANLLTSSSGYDLITTNSGELVFSPTIG